MDRRVVLVILLGLLASPVADAQGMMPPPGSVWTVFTTVDAVVRDNYATVKVIAEIANRGPDPEFPFVVRIPDDAFVTGLTILRDGTVFEAEIKDRATARQEYEDWKSQQQTGGIVEKTRRTSVYSYLINVAEFTSVTATLTYERYLSADRGVYNLSLEAPVSGFGRDLGARFHVQVKDSDGVVAIWGDEGGSLQGSTLVYEVGPRAGTEFPTPFTASYTLLPTDDAGTLLTTVVDGKGYFAHRFRAPTDAQELPMDLVLVLDVSGSMAGLKLDQMIDSAKQVVATLRNEDTLHLVAFSSDSTSPWSGLLSMTPENRKRAAREIDALFDGGGTNIEAGLRRGFAAFDGISWAAEEGRFPALVLLTDGQPTVGITSRDDLKRLAQKLNEHNVPVFGIAFGDDADWTLIRQLAEEGDGAAIRVPLGQGAEVDLRRFMAALTTPVLRDVTITYSEGVMAYDPNAPVLFANSELLVVGTFDPARGIRGTVTGFSPEGERRFTFAAGEPAALPYLPRLVAYREVRMLQEEEETGGQTTSTTQRITELALRYGFVTDHTSLVLTLPEQPQGRDWTVDEVSSEGSRDTPNTASSSPSWSGVGSSAPIAPPIPPRNWPTNAPTSGGVRDLRSSDSDTAGDPRDGASNAEPAVPGPGVALVIVSLAALALLARKKK